MPGVGSAGEKPGTFSKRRSIHEQDPPHKQAQGPEGQGPTHRPARGNRV